MRLMHRSALPGLLLWTALAACGGGGGKIIEPPPTVSCTSPALIALAAGGHVVVDPSTSSGCLRLPAVAAGGAEEEYLVGVVSGSGLVTTAGVSGPFHFKGSTGATAVPPAFQLVPEPARAPGNAEIFHANLRRLESALAADPSVRPALRAPGVAAAPPAVGSQRTFNVCSNLQCTAFSQVTAVARHVGAKVAVYLDLTVPTQDTLTQADLVDLGQTFDTRLYPIVQTAFGSESDIDGNGVVAILLTDAVNALTPDCTNGRVLGFFWGGDLITVNGSNRGEVFYGMVPSPATSGCSAASRRNTVDRLKPTMIHELQHMISYNQHVLVSAGTTGEVAWLNEGLSHYAEELGGRLIPNSECPGFTSCRSQYTSGDLFNAYDFLKDTEAHYLVFPSSSSGTLPERGAAWLFVRWLADHWGSDSLGTNVTRALVQTALTGSANVQTVTGTPFATLAAEWFAAIWADDLPGFTPGNPRISFKSWGFRSIFAANCCTQNAPFPSAWPAVLPVVAGTYSRAGTLRGGSGKHFQVIRPAGASALDLTVARDGTGTGLDAALATRVVVVRIR